MRVQTYALWVHRPALAKDVNSADDIAGFIDDLISCVAYYPSFTVQITPDGHGHLLAGAQQIDQVDEQSDGMVALRTGGAKMWITHAAYHRLVA
jgi:hypothetical protein